MDGLGLLEKYSLERNEIFWKNKTKIFQLLAFVQQKLSSHLSHSERELIYDYLHVVISSIKKQKKYIRLENRWRKQRINLLQKQKHCLKDTCDFQEELFCNLEQENRSQSSSNESLQNELMNLLEDQQIYQSENEKQMSMKNESQIHERKSQRKKTNRKNKQFLSDQQVSKIIYKILYCAQQLFKYFNGRKEIDRQNKKKNEKVENENKKPKDNCESFKKTGKNIIYNQLLMDSLKLRIKQLQDDWILQGQAFFKKILDYYKSGLVTPQMAFLFTKKLSKNVFLKPVIRDFFEQLNDRMISYLGWKYFFLTLIPLQIYLQIKLIKRKYEEGFNILALAIRTLVHLEDEGSGYVNSRFEQSYQKFLLKLPVQFLKEKILQLLRFNNLPRFYVYLLFMMYSKVSHILNPLLKQKIINVLSCRAHIIAKRDFFWLRIGLVQEGFSMNLVNKPRKSRVLSHLWTRYYYPIENIINCRNQTSKEDQNCDSHHRFFNSLYLYFQNKKAIEKIKNKQIRELLTIKNQTLKKSY